MQLPALFRRGIVTPLTDAAAEQLSKWWVVGRIQIDFLPIESDSLFEELWQTGVFQEINHVCSTLIGNYEEESLQAAQLRAALAVVDAKSEMTRTGAARAFLRALSAILKSAIEGKRPVYFIL